MNAKEMLKNAITGSGDVAQTTMQTATDVVKAGTVNLEELFGAAMELGKEGAVDVTSAVKGIFIGAVNALKESGKSSEDAVTEVTVKAESAIGKVGEEGANAVVGAAREGVKQAKEVVKEPFEK